MPRMTSNAKTVAEYLKELPADRRAAISKLRQVIKKNLDKGFVETMQYGGICYVVPHKLYPAGYHCNPKDALPFAGLGSQKHHIGVYLMCIYYDEKHVEAFKKDWAKSGKKLDMGKSCVRFKKIEDASLEAIGNAIKRVTLKKFIAMYESVKPKK